MRPIIAGLDISVCTGKVCKKQGSTSVLQFAQNLQLDEVVTSACGCLAGCGNGPNLVVQQQGKKISPVKIAHVGTAAQFLEVLRTHGVQLDEQLEMATALRLRGNEAAKVQDYSTAISCYIQVRQSRCLVVECTAGTMQATAAARLQPLS